MKITIKMDVDTPDIEIIRGEDSAEQDSVEIQNYQSVDAMIESAERLVKKILFE